MENGTVYSPTTEDNPGSASGVRSRIAACLSMRRLKWPQRVLKLFQLVLSLLAFICEEVVSQCTLCGGLYFFEFISSSAFLLSLLILIVYCTPVYDKVDAEKVRSSDFYITVGIGSLFLLASIVFVSMHDRTSAEIAATVFGFFASAAFLADGLFMKLWGKRHLSQMRKTETATSEPLNSARE
ncbi:CKLF-like MARVEL transmembrane domain-containing protein 6 [Pteronotus mesoamericanus]|uniref:CKLF-like MARVEL transmembrane domain-containing protein 6 n=1 Tax=Pteronotus mesoamericanus TaxID=1884717 RepID=UPI0023ED2635|nr:CKLF-like MARVEL transmembrane domain-containing protein 6 [Pteronotus parnellii mesoamericanus]